VIHITRISLIADTADTTVVSAPLYLLLPTTRHDRRIKLFWVSTICAQILGFSRIYYKG